jgi:hypothetical protein
MGCVNCSGGLGRLRKWLRRAILRLTAYSKALRDTGGSRSPKELLEVAVLGKDVGQRLVHDLICRGVEEGCVLVNLFGGGYVKANRRIDVAGLNNLKQRH